MEAESRSLAGFGDGGDAGSLRGRQRALTLGPLDVQSLAAQAAEAQNIANQAAQVTPRLLPSHWHMAISVCFNSIEFSWIQS